MMHYQSLIRFLNYAQIDYANGSLDWSRVKRIVNAEFAMQTDGIITIEGFAYTKHDVLQEIENPNIDTLLSYHLYIWEAPLLLQALETLNLPQNAALPMPEDDDFVQWLSPYWSSVFQKNMARYLQEHRLSNATALLSYSGFVAPEDEEVTYVPIRHYLDEIMKLFRNLNDQSYKARSAELNLWVAQPWAAFLNALPESLWSYTDDVANDLINFTVRIQDASKKLCYLISEQLVALKHVNYSYRELILSNHSIYKERYNKTQPLGRLKSIPYTYIIVFLLILMLRIINKGSTCNDSTPINSEAKVEAVAHTPEGKLFNHLRNQVAENAYAQLNDSALTIPNTLANLSKYQFKPAPIYFRWDPLYTNDIYTLVLRNKTEETLYIDICSKSNIYTYSCYPNIVYYISSHATADIDFVIHTDSTDMPWAAMQKQHVDTFQYLYLADIEGLNFSKNLKFNEGKGTSFSDQRQPIHKQINNSITINKDSGTYQLSTQQEASIVLASPKPIVPSIAEKKKYNEYN
jgi:hypothetical protein